MDMQKPPPDFRTNFEATHPPILIDNGLAVLENEKIERHIMKSVPGGHNLFVQVSFSILSRIALNQSLSSLLGHDLFTIDLNLTIGFNLTINWFKPHKDHSTKKIKDVLRTKNAIQYKRAL